MSMMDFKRLFTNELQNINQQQAPSVNQYSRNLNPNLYVNPYYMQPANRDALAPMAMLQQYRDTGNVTPMPNSFIPYTPPQADIANVQQIYTATPTNNGGK